MSSFLFILAALALIGFLLYLAWYADEDVLTFKHRVITEDVDSYYGLTVSVAWVFIICSALCLIFFIRGVLSMKPLPYVK